MSYFAIFGGGGGSTRVNFGNLGGTDFFRMIFNEKYPEIALIYDQTISTSQ
jgi:hypothetical protein